MSALRRLRLDKNLSPTELAEESGVSSVTITAIEDGNVERPRTATLAKLAQALGVKTSEIDPVLTAEISPEERAA